ncbi:HPr(Ser) kinase/phosphatase [Acidobacteriota bacterium]
MNGEKPAEGEGVRISELLGEGTHPTDLTLAAGGKGLDKRITGARIQKPGFALSGNTEFTHPGRVQILGYSEIAYLNSLSPEERKERLSGYLNLELCCLIVTSDATPPAELVELAEDTKTPLLRTPLSSSMCVDRVSLFLERKLAPRKVIHGDFLEVFGVGVLIIGDSGIGKSECALELISRGQRLISDDVVEITQEGHDILIGSGPELTRYHMEIRGLGLINIKDLFGISSIRHSKPVELVVLLKIWRAGDDVDRLGLRDSTMKILDVEMPMVMMPVAPGRNLAILVEVAARNHILKAKGQHAARDLVKRVNRIITENSHQNGEED